MYVNEHGELEAETELGMVKFTKPVAYQEIEGKRVDVSVEYRIQESAAGDRGLGIGGTESRGAGEQGGRGALETQNSKPTYGFKVASYDKTKPLIIDPLLASTYVGGSSIEEGYSVAIDAGGNVYVTGVTYSEDFPTTPGAYQTSHKGGGDVFVSRFSGDLTKLLASTYVGGSDWDWAFSVAIDAGGNVYVSGETSSTDFPTTPGAYQTSNKGGQEVFVSRLSGDLTTLLASTYLGGDSSEFGRSVAIDTGGNVYVTGWSYSADFPTTPGAYQTSFKGGPDDVFVSRFSGDLTTLLASTYVGGSGDEDGFSVAIDAGGNVYVTAQTVSEDFPTTPGAYQTSLKGDWDVTVSRLSGDLTTLLASTYLGGYNPDWGNSVAIDAGGNVYVTGPTYSEDFPTTPGAYQTSKEGDFDVFVSRLSGDLTKLLASTYLGGSDGADYGYSVAIDAGGNVYVAGTTGSTDFPTTLGAYQTSNKGSMDVFVSRLDANLSAAVDTTPPTVVSTSPGSNAVGVALDSVITAVFSEKLDASTINTSTFYLNGGVTGTVSYDKSTNTATFTPYSNLSNTTTYTATITTGVKDVAGNNMAANYSWSFTTMNLCKAKSITTAPKKLTLSRNGNGNVTITVKGDGDCLVEGVTVTATINGEGKQLIAVSPGSQKTDASGQAVFAIHAKNDTGTAVVKFKASGLNKSATVQVKVK